MNNKLVAVLAVAALGSATSLSAMASPTKEAPASAVEFLEPENFTDFRTRDYVNRKDQEHLEKELRKEIERIAHANLPPGYRLELRFRDIDMAGDFEPWHGPRYNDVRIVRDIYAPRMDVEFAIVNEAGETVRSGERRLRDPSHMWRISLRHDDLLVRETEMLKDFIREITRELS